MSDGGQGSGVRMPSSNLRLRTLIQLRSVGISDRRRSERGAGKPVDNCDEPVTQQSGSARSRIIRQRPLAQQLHRVGGSPWASA